MAGMSVMHDVAEKVRRLGVPGDVTLEPVLISSHGTTEALDRTGFFSHTLCLADLMDADS